MMLMIMIIKLIMIILLFSKSYVFNAGSNVDADPVDVFNHGAVDGGGSDWC